MKLSCDASALEWNVAVFLSQDTTGIEEILNQYDIHERNRAYFGLPERRIAKIFLFRLIYGGSAWSYANDPDFNGVSRDPKFWQGIIDATYAKYRGLQRWHNQLMADVCRDGFYESVSGRIYRFQPYKKSYGAWEWPRTTILNYPVQGLAAEIIMLARIELHKRFKAKGYKSLLINTIHDSIEVDALEEEWYNIYIDMKQVYEELPQTFERNFGVPYNLPLRCEVSKDGVKEEKW